MGFGKHKPAQKETLELTSAQRREEAVKNFNAKLKEGKSFSSIVGALDKILAEELNNATDSVNKFEVGGVFSRMMEFAESKLEETNSDQIKALLKMKKNEYKTVADVLLAQIPQTEKSKAPEDYQNAKR